MRAMDVMTTEVITVTPTASVQSVARLLSERDVRGVHREMDMGVDESGAHRPPGEINHPCAGRSPHRRRDLRNPIILDENLRRTSQGVGDAIEDIAAHQNECIHLNASSRHHPSDYSAHVRSGPTAQVRRRWERASRGE